MPVFERGYLKRDSTKAGSGLIFKGLRLEAIAEYLVIIGKSLLKPLKIRPPAMNPIDILLRRSA